MRFPIKYISRLGPNEPADVRFLESVPFDYHKARERKAALEHMKRYADFQIVIYRTSRRRSLKANGRGAFVLSRENSKPKGAASKPRKRNEPMPINYTIYAIAKSLVRTKAYPSPPDAATVRSNDKEAIGICNNNGQQGDPTVGGNH